jgi:hypothetical protein
LFRGHGIRTLLLEALGIAVVLGVAGALIYFHQKPKPVKVLLPVAGRAQNISHDARVQFAPAVAIAPTDARVLLGGSSDGLSDTRVYGSTDGGSSWTSDPGPPLLRGNCNLNEPAVAITADGHQVFVFGASEFCDLPMPQIHVATRTGPHARWKVQPLLPVKGYARDFNFTLATSGRRVWLAWARRIHRFSSTHVAYLAASSDDGATWSAPKRIPVPQPFALSLVAMGSAVALVAADGDDNTLVALRSVDGGRTFAQRRTIASFTNPYSEDCEGVSLPPQSRFCIPPTPSAVADASGRLLVVWGDEGPNGTADLHFARLSPALRLLEPPHRIGPPDRELADQFDPSLAFDRSDGAVWACFMDTDGDPYRRRAWPTCMVSRDGGRSWSTPVHVTAPPSDETQTASNLRGYGTTAVVAERRIAHVLWTDTRNILTTGEDIFASRVPERAALCARRPDAPARRAGACAAS